MSDVQTGHLPDASRLAPIPARLDAPHEPAAQVAPACDRASRASQQSEFVSSDEESEARLHAQARQLTTLLDERQSDLDRREENLHGQLAALDRDRSAARMWLAERQRELDWRAAEITRREAEVADRTSRLLAAEADHRRTRQEAEFYLSQHEQELQQRETQLELASQRLEKRTVLQQHALERWQHEKETSASELRRAAADLEVRRITCEETVRASLAALQRRRDALESRAVEIEAAAQQPSPVQRGYAEKLRVEAERLTCQRRALDELDELLRRERTELASQRDELQTERRRLEADRKADREHAAGARRHLDEESAARRRVLELEAAKLDERRTAVEKMQADVGIKHREALELRLATEQIWMRLVEHAEEQELSTNVNRLHEELAESYGAEAAHVEAERQALESLRDDLAAELSRFTEQQKRWEQACRQNQHALQMELARIETAGHDLRRREEELEQQRDDWRQQSADYQQEIRRLRVDLDRRATAGA